MISGEQEVKVPFSAKVWDQARFRGRRGCSSALNFSEMQEGDRRQRGEIPSRCCPFGRDSSSSVFVRGNFHDGVEVFASWIT